VRVDLTVILDPFGQQVQDGVGVWKDGGRSIVPLQGFDEGLGHAVALWAANRSEEQNNAKGSSHLGCLPGDVGTAIVGEPFEPVRDLKALEAAFNR
jgi:hypothetical protein